MILQINLMYVQRKNAEQGQITNSSNKGDIFMLPEITDEILQDSRFFLYFQDDQNGFSEEQFMDYVYNFDVHRDVHYRRECQEYKRIQTSLMKKLNYSCNLKIASLRLGDTMLWISRHESKNKNLLNVAFISTMLFSNPNKHNLTVFLFCYDKNKRRFLTEEGKRNRNIILKNIEPYMTEDNLFSGHEKGNHLYIFDLKRLPKSKLVNDYEFSYDAALSDILYKKKGSKVFQRKDLINKLPDYSLTHYIKFLYQSKPKATIILNNTAVSFENYQDLLESLRAKQKLISFVLPEQYKEFGDCGKYRLYRVKEDIDYYENLGKQLENGSAHHADPSQAQQHGEESKDNTSAAVAVRADAPSARLD